MIIWFAGNVGQSDKYAEPILKEIPRRLVSYYAIIEKGGIELDQALRFKHEPRRKKK